MPPPGWVWAEARSRGCWPGSVARSPPDVKARAYTGEIRDFATFPLEPAAELEFWSDLPDYAPAAAPGKPLVLWLRDCQPLARVHRGWRSTSAETACPAGT